MKRSLSLPFVLLYGLGTTIGAGIYALVGEVAATAGMHTPVSFALASLLAAFSAFTFAELAARYPRSAGEAVYVREAFGLRRLALLVGLSVMAAGTVSAAAMVTACVGYTDVADPVAATLLVVVVATALGALAAWGIEESVRVASLITVVELLGLAVVSFAASGGIENGGARIVEIVPDASSATWLGVLSGSVLAFYAFLGFEDMVKVAEETRDVRRTLPAAILATLVITTLIYVVVATTCVLAVPPVDLAASKAPLAYVFERTTGRSPHMIRLVSQLAIVNGGLVQIIMAARILYGLADEGALPAALAKVSPHTRTPLLATALVTLGVIALAISFPLAPLAAATSILTLAVFALVNLALIWLKWREPSPPGVRTYPAWVPVAGFATSSAFLSYGLFDAIAGRF